MFCLLNYLILPSTGMSLSLLIEVAQGFFPCATAMQVVKDLRQYSLMV